MSAESVNHRHEVGGGMSAESVNHRRKVGGESGRMNQILAVCLLAVLANEDWKPLLDGQSLKGWTQRGGVAKYRVENGEIIGTSVPNTGNSFLCTDKDYGDFILELEFKVHPKLNSGVQIRSQSFD